MSATSNDRLTRNKQDGMIAGVCAGIATRYGYDVGLVRLVAVLLTVVSLGAGGIVLYAAAWVLIPAADSAPPASMGERRREQTGEVTGSPAD
jgi:phage shock protein PspC (stress-responsive transcriptional regulator)